MTEPRRVPRRPARPVEEQLPEPPIRAPRPIKAQPGPDVPPSAAQQRKYAPKKRRRILR